MSNALPTTGPLWLSQVTTMAFSNTANATGPPYLMSGLRASPLQLVGASNTYPTTGSNFSMGAFLGATLPTGLPIGPSLKLLPRTVSYFNIQLGGNINKWYDYATLLTKYGTSQGYIYFFFCGGIYRMRFNGSQNSQIRNTDFQYFQSGTGWVTATSAQLPCWSGGYPPTFTSSIVEIEDQPALSSSSLTNSNVGCAYSLRNINHTYTGPVVNVRRSSDNATADFYASPVGSLLCTSGYQDYSAWLGSSTGYVTTWYDQVAGNNATQTTTAYQPTLVYDSISKMYVISFAGGVNGTSTSGFYITSGIATYGIHCHLMLNTNSSGWQSIVCKNVDNAGLRLANSTFLLNGSDSGLDYDYTNYYSSFDTGAATFVNGASYTVVSGSQGAFCRQPRGAISSRHEPAIL